MHQQSAVSPDLPEASSALAYAKAGIAQRMNTRTWAIAIAFGFGHTLQTVKTNRQRPIHRSVLQQLLDKLTSPRGVKPPATAPAVWGSQRESGLAQEHARFGAMTFHDLRNTQAGVSVKRLSHEFSPCQEFA